MHERTAERVEAWDARPFSGGASALHALADEGFSGAVVAGDVWLFYVNGRPVGVHGGTVEAVADATGTVHEAPDVSVALLVAMQEADGETQARYYTNETSLEETDETLRNAGFTGYVELSENVLSGDYYVGYYGGRSLPAAFVGNAPELLTGEEAFERAADEVGVYEVVSAELGFPDLPEADPEPAPAVGTDETGDDDDPRDESDTERSDDAEDPARATAAATSEAASETNVERADDSDADPAHAGVTFDDAERPSDDSERLADDGERSTDDGGTPAEASEAAEAPDAESATADDADEGHESAGGTGVTEADDEPGSDAVAAGDVAPDEAADGAEPDAPTAESAFDADVGSDDAVLDAAPATAVERERAPDREREGEDAGEAPRVTGTESARAGDAASDDVFSKEEAWRETTAVPALAPDESRPQSADATADASTEDREAGRAAEPSPPRSGKRARDDAADADPERLADLRAAVEEREARIETLEGRLAAAEDAVEEREDELASVRAERDDLRETVERFEKRVATLEDELAAAEAEATEADAEAAAEAAEAADAASPDDVPAARALAGTNLFVRYGSKAEPTLDAVGEADRSAIDANLALEHHTTFDADGTTVDGEPYEAFLRETAAYRFVSWVVRELPFEIIDTGHRQGLAGLYGAIPDVDRAELGGTVAVDDEEGDPVRREFDVVLRDRMGEPLAVAQLKTDRDPVTGDAMSSLTEAATAVSGGTESLGAALYVTASFFEPDALEAAAEATTSGGLLSRSEKESYVKVARKRGYHLCLVEDRNGSFHVTVPEL